MKTSAVQFELMVSYMERHGDLSRPFDGPHGRGTNIQRWLELTNILNAEATGESKTEEKWRKTWSDLKNNTKRKAAKIRKSINSTGGGPPLKLQLSSLEERVLAIINPQAATGMQMPEVGLEVIINESNLPQVPQQQEEYSNDAQNSSGIFCEITPAIQSPPAILVENMQTPQPPPAILVENSQTLQPPPPPQPSTSSRVVHNRAPPRRRQPSTSQSELSRQAFMNSDQEWRTFAAHRDDRHYELEKERLRLREIELLQQARWQELVTQFMEVLQNVSNYFIKKT